MIEGKEVALVATAGLYTPFRLATAQDISTWPFKGYVYDPAAPTIALAELTINVDTSTKQIVAILTETQVADMVTTGNSRTLAYVIYCKPGGAQTLRFFYGDFIALAAAPPTGIA